MKKILSKLMGKAVKGKKGKIILLLAIALMLPLFSVASGAVAAWSFVVNLASSVLGFFGLEVNSSKADKVDISKYTIEELIDVADDKHIITDEALKNMMLDRESYKKLLVAINKKNTEYDSATKTIEYKHTYTTTKVVGGGSMSTRKKEKNPFIPSKPSSSPSPSKNTVPGPANPNPDTSERIDTDSPIIVKEKHVDYIKKDITVSSETLEGEYKIAWQSVLLAVQQNFLYNYYSLTHEEKEETDEEEDIEDRSEDSLKDANEVDKSDDDVGQVEESAYTGEDIVEYAREWVGKTPYVWGGDNLETGCDSTGFVRQVYAHFAVNLKHTAAEIESQGKEVCTAIDEKKMQPGDIICFRDKSSSHLSIYSGEGMMIHAMDEDSGTVESEIKEFKKKLVTVRRIIASDEEKGEKKKLEKGSVKVKQMSARKSKSNSTTKANKYDGADKKLVGNSNEARIWNYFKAKELSDMAVSAIMGNFYAESGFNPKSGYPNGPCGIASWLKNGRWKNVEKRGNEWDLLVQLNYAWDELRNVYPDVLQYISQPEHVLEYRSASDPGSVYMFAYRFEGCVGDGGGVISPDRMRYNIQDYDKRLSAAQKILKAYGGTDGLVTEGKIFTAADTADAGVTYLAAAKLGKFDKKTGMVNLSDDDISTILEDFRPKFNYTYDFVRDEKKSFSFDECKNMVNNGLQNNGGSPDTETGLYEWYMPSSTLTSVELPYMDITYTNNMPSDYYVNMPRWENIMGRYMETYDGEYFRELLFLMPNGKDAYATFEYYISLANGKTSTSASSGSPLPNGEISNANGEYKPLKNVVPSIEMKDCGGMSIPLYLQYDSRWGSLPFGVCGGTISSSGCSITSIAMVVSYMTGKCIYPSDVREWNGPTHFMTNVGASYGIFPAAASHWGLKCAQQTVNADAIRNALKQSRPVIVSTSGYGTTQEFTKAGHFIVLRGLTKEGKVLVNDPNDSNSKVHWKKAYSAEFIVSECTASGTRKPMFIFTK